MITMYQLVGQMKKDGKTADEIKRVLIAGGWQPEAIDEAIAKISNHEDSASVLEMADVRTVDRKRNSTLLAVGIILLAAVGVILGIYFSIPKPLTQQDLELKAGFSVLLPGSLPTGYVIEKYLIEDKSDGTKKVTFFITDKKERKIRVIQTPLENTEGLVEYISNTYSDSEIKDVTVLQHPAYLISPLVSTEEESPSLLLLWEDPARRFRVEFSPAEVFSEAGMIGVAESLYR